ncbi:MAG: transcriptional repressor LexA [Proteobacteria bacterium]|nr:transcriptional repressor LexA [Pseudomonadota bacterium]
MKLTRRQQQILEYIRKFIKENQFPPSIRDIAAHLSLASAGGVHKHLNNLKKKGVISFENNISRSIRVLDDFEEIQKPEGSSMVNTRLLELPLMGKVAAGLPIQYFLENESIEYPESMIRKPKDTYVLQVQGNSMIEDCICDGDYVIVEHRDHADNGDMVVAMINHNEATLKRFYLEGDKVRLQPANQFMEPIYANPRDLTIHGIIVGVLRQYR